MSSFEPRPDLRDTYSLQERPQFGDTHGAVDGRLQSAELCRFIVRMIDNLSTVLPEKLRRGGLLSGSLCLQLSHRRVLESKPGHAPVPETRENPTVLTCFRGLHVVT